MASSLRWSRPQLLLAFRLYCQEPFGRLHTRNPAVKEVARLIGRTPSAVVLKACNLASLDPFHQARGVSGMQNVSRADRALWAEFEADSEQIAGEAEAAYEQLVGDRRTSLTVLESAPSAFDIESIPAALDVAREETVAQALVRVRRVQSFFRRAVLASYRDRCAISGVPLPELLNASHIIPWNADARRRADPRNGIALHALYDRAFDRGYLTFDDELRVVVSPLLRVERPSDLHAATLLAIEGRALERPERFAPDPAALAWHRERVFREG